MPRMTIVIGAVALGLVLAVAPVAAQESVSLSGVGPYPLPGDAVVPWDDAASGPFGTEQCNHYVVDLEPFESFSGTLFGIAPIIKSSKTSSDYFSSLVSAQSISRLERREWDFPADSYFVWDQPGFGVNNNEALNSTPATVDTSESVGNQFGVLFSEYATSDEGASYNGIIGGLVNYLPADPTRLYVSRINAAVNSCDNASNYAQMGVGTVDEDGHLHFRADGQDTTGGTCTSGLGAPLTPFFPTPAQNNIFRVDMSGRDCDILNVISDDYPAGRFDSVATEAWLVHNSVTVHNTPNTMPASVTGGNPLYLGSNFLTQYLRGSTFPVTADSSHLAPGVGDHRGAIAYTTKNCTRLNSTHGMAGILGVDENTDATDIIDVFGLNAVGNVTGTLALKLPGTITDVTTGLTNRPGNNLFNHYHSQTAFLGGNSQVALGVDQEGNLLAAAEVDHFGGGNDHPYNYIGVAQVDCDDTGTSGIKWTMAGYITTNGIDKWTGKPIVNSNGQTIGQMTLLTWVTDGDPVGPSVSAPMIDSVGNVWFLSAIHLYDDPNNPPPPGSPACTNGFCSTGLLRAVYSADYQGTGQPGYELELVFKNGQVFHGQNSNRDYQIRFLQIADSDSVASGTTWSSNISEVAHLGVPPTGLETSNPQTLGGLVLAAEIVYDVNNDGNFTKSTGAGGDPNSPDEDYNVLLYLGAYGAGDTEPPYIVGDWESYKPAVGAAPELYIPIAQVGSPTQAPFKGVETRRGLITDLRITFSEAIQLPALTDVTMTRWAGGSTNPTGVSLDVTGTILTTTWTAVGDAAMVGAADIYTVCLQNIVDLAGNPLTGDNDIEVWQQFGNVQLAPAGATRRSTGNADISLMNANFVDPTDLARARFDVWNAPVGATGGKVNNSDVSQLSARFSTLNAAAVPPTCP